MIPPPQWVISPMSTGNYSGKAKPSVSNWADDRNLYTVFWTRFSALAEDRHYLLAVVWTVESDRSSLLPKEVANRQSGLGLQILAWSHRACP
jgi:hypothetical protein